MGMIKIQSLREKLNPVPAAPVNIKKILKYKNVIKNTHLQKITNKS